MLGDQPATSSTASRRKPISVQLDVGDGLVRIRTSGWHENQDVTVSPVEVLDWLCAASDNGHRVIEVVVWSDDR